MYLHSNSTQILAYIKKTKLEKKNYLFSMLLFSADAIVFSKKNLNFFLTPKKGKNGPQKLLIIGPDPFFHRPAQATAHSPKLTFHIMKSRDQTSVLLSVRQSFFLSCHSPESDCTLHFASDIKVSVYKTVGTEGWGPGVGSSLVICYCRFQLSLSCISLPFAPADFDQLIFRKSF